MAFWIALGLLCIIPSAYYMALRWWKKEKHTDTVLTKLFDWPLIVTGVLLMVPGFIWYDVTIGLIAMIFWEVYKWVIARRKREELALARELAANTKGDAA